MVSTRLDDSQLVVYYTDPDATETIVHVINKVLQEYGEVIVNNAQRQKLKDNNPRMEYQYKLKIRFDLRSEDLVVGDLIADAVRDKIEEMTDVSELDVQYRS